MGYNSICVSSVSCLERDSNVLCNILMKDNPTMEGDDLDLVSVLSQSHFKAKVLPTNDSNIKSATMIQTSLPKPKDSHIQVEYITPDIGSIHFTAHVMKRIGADLSTNSNQDPSSPVVHPLVEILKEIQQLSLTFQQLIKEVPRKQTHTDLDHIRESYLQLFEKAMELLLKLDKKKENEWEKKAKDQREKLEDLQTQAKYMTERNSALENACKAKDIVAQISDIIIKELEKQVSHEYIAMIY